MRAKKRKLFETLLSNNNIRGLNAILVRVLTLWK